MKTGILGFIIVLAASNVLAQGTVIFNNRIAGSLITHVYAPVDEQAMDYIAGYGANDFPSGTVTWSGPPLSGSGYSAQLWAAVGANQPESALLPATPTTSFRTGSAAGWVAGTTATLTGVPADAPVATLALRAWDNRGGTLTTWGQALGQTEVGESPLFNLNAIGGTLNPAPALIGLQSFNIVGGPEPSTFVIGGLGALLMVWARRNFK